MNGADLLSLPAPVTTPVSATTPVASGAATPEVTRRIIVLCGVVGTGKTSLSKAIVRQMPNWARVCQDELSDRRACEDMARSYLAQGYNLIVDRQNFDAAQRKHWIQIGRSFNIEVDAVVLTTSYEECQRRLLVRQDHETIASPGMALQLLDQFSRSWRPPSANEDFDRIVKLPAAIPLEPDRATIESLLALIDASPKLARQQTLDAMFGSANGVRRTFAPPPRLGAWGTPGRRLDS